MERILPLTSGANGELRDLEHLFKLQAEKTLDAIIIEASRTAVADGRMVITASDIQVAAFGRPK